MTDPMSKCIECGWVMNEHSLSCRRPEERAEMIRTMPPGGYLIDFESEGMNMADIKALLAADGALGLKHNEVKGTP